MRIIVLGTGTSVGKTWVSRALTRALRLRNAAIVALKPIETGVVSNAVASPERAPAGASDAALLAIESSTTPSPPPYVFAEAISPHLAARRAQQAIELPRVLEYVARHETAMTSHVTSFVLVESAGGCFSPLAPELTNADLAVALEPAVWVLVAPDALGVLHDVTATLAALGARYRMPDHLVLSEARTADASTGTNAAELASLGIGAPVLTARRGDDRALDALAEALLRPATNH